MLLAHERPFQTVPTRRRHFKEQAAKVGTYNASAGLGTYMVPREQQREEIASDYYYGGMVVERTGQLHPALYYGGLLSARRAGARQALRPVRCREDRARKTAGASGCDQRARSRRARS